MKLTGLLTVEQQLLLKIVIRLGKIEKKLDAQNTSIAAIKKQVDAAAQYAQTRLYENCLGIQSIYAFDARIVRCRNGNCASAASNACSSRMVANNRVPALA